MPSRGVWEFFNRLLSADANGFNACNASDFIRKRACQLFEMRGWKSGHELEDWLLAEQEIKARLLELRLAHSRAGGISNRIGVCALIARPELITFGS